MLKRSKDNSGYCTSPKDCIGPHCEGCRHLTQRKECVHGSLEEKCPICERDDEIAELRAEVGRLRGRWILPSVSLPKAGVPVLARIRWKMEDGWKYRTIRAQYAEQFTSLESIEDETSEYSEEKDEYFVREGWYEDNEFEETHWRVDGEVTHWMSIPEPPAWGQEGEG